MSRRKVAILLILVLAAALRLHGISKSIWFDEAATVHIVRQPIGQMIDSIRSDERTPPLYYLVLHFWVKVFGDSEISLRMPSVIAGVISVWVLYRLTRRLINEPAGLAAALMMAASSYQIVYSQEARAYSLMVLMALLSCDLFIRLLEQRTPRLEALYVIVTAALLYSHMYGIYVVAAQAIAYWFWPKNSRLALRRMVLDFAAALVLFSPWLPTALRWTRGAQSSFWIALPPASLDDIAAAFYIYAGSTTLLALLLVLAVIGIWQTPNRRSIVLLLALLLIPVVIPVLIGALTRPTFIPRYGLVAAPVLFVLAAAGMAALKWNSGLLLALAVLIALALCTVPNETNLPDWRSIAVYLSPRVRPTDVVVLNRKNSTYLYDYYVHRSDVRRFGFDGSAIPLSLPLDAGRHVWLVYNSEHVTLNDIFARAPWRVLSHKRVVDVLVLELTDQPADGNVTTTRSSATPPPTPSP